ncbi:hypothetical protein ACTFIZ_007850 [Dictyostelium cf. discoideum]
MGNKNSLAQSDGTDIEFLSVIKEKSKEEEFINVVKNFIQVCEKIMKKENKNFLENQKKFIKLISNTIKESKYCGDISSDIYKNLINIRENYLLVALDQINSSPKKIITTCQLKIDIDILMKLIDVGKDPKIRVPKLNDIKSELDKLVEAINSQKDNLFYKKLFKFFKINQKIEDHKKSINLTVMAIGCIPAGVITASVVITIGLSAIPFTIPVSIFLLGCASTLIYLINKSINTGRIYDHFLHTITAINCKLYNFISQLKICSNSVCSDLTTSLNLLEKSENKIVSKEHVEAIIKTIDKILKQIETIQSLSKNLISLEEYINDEGTEWNLLRSIRLFSAKSQSSLSPALSPTSSSQSMEIVKK